MIAIYARQSVDKKDSISIETQIETCRKHIEADVEPIVFKDPGYSGKNTDRPDFQKMLSQIEIGNISKVVVYKLDRISRSLLDFTAMYESFKKQGVEFYSCGEHFDTSTPMGKAMLSISVVFAELERETIQKRVTDNYYDRLKMGFFAGGPTPYGFDKIRTSIHGKKTSMFVSNPDKIKVIEHMYDTYANTSSSLGKISDWLNEQDLPAPNGGRWDSCKLSRIMHSPVYVKADSDVYEYYKNRGCAVTNAVTDFIGVNACFLYGKREANERKYTDVSDHVLSMGLHEGVIDSRTWLACQKKLDSNRQIKNTGRGKHSWLSGLVKCGKCGYTMTVITADSKNKYKYFNCRGKTNLKICGGHSRSPHVVDIEQAVKSQIDLYAATLNTRVEQTQTVNNVKNNKLKAEITRIDEKIQAFFDNISEVSAATLKHLDNQINKLDIERQKLVGQLETAESAIADRPFNEIKECVGDWDNATLEQKKSVARSLIRVVKINEGNVDIVWKY